MHIHFTDDLLYCSSTTILYKVVPFPRKNGMSHLGILKSCGMNEMEEESKMIKLRSSEIRVGSQRICKI